MLRIQLFKPKLHSKTARSQAHRYAIRFGLFTALVIVIYNMIIQAGGDGGFEFAHVAIFFILFFMIGYGMHQSRKWIRPEHEMDDRMLFGLVMSGVTALGVVALSGLFLLANYHLIVSETFLPINNGWRFAVNAMALFWSCLIFGFLSAFIFSNIYEKG